MRVDESLTFEEYWRDPRFKSKRPHWTKNAPIVEKCGDNCYQPTGHGAFRQRRSGHWDHKRNRKDNRKKSRDLGGERVLIGKRFCYYGGDAVPFPAHVRFRPRKLHRQGEDGTAQVSEDSTSRRSGGTERLARGRLVLAAIEPMRLILSRKGFDSSSGGCSSPIFPDGSMIALPIPDKRSPIQYQDLTWRGRNLGDVVAQLTNS